VDWFLDRLGERARDQASRGGDEPRRRGGEQMTSCRHGADPYHRRGVMSLRGGALAVERGELDYR
jgi:hypothetical protein